MSILIIGGDKVGKIEALIKSMGATNTEHWNSRRHSTCHREIPSKTDGIIMLTDFLNHNAMTHFKQAAKKREIPYICVRRGTANICQAFSKICESCPRACHANPSRSNP